MIQLKSKMTEESGLLAVLKFTMTVCTFVQFLSGTPTCWSFYKRGHTGEISCIPFIAGVLNCSVWFKYGLLTEEPALKVVISASTTVQYK